MIDHLSTYTTDYDASKRFYGSVFQVLGYSLQMEFVAEWNRDFPSQRMCAFGPEDHPIFWIIESKEAYTPRHTAFSANSRALVAQFYWAGMQNGAEDNGSPGLRPTYHEHYYAAFLLDPDGNNIEVVCHSSE